MRDYLAAVERADYRAAAELLAAGSRPGDARPDLTPLALDEVTVDSIAVGTGVLPPSGGSGKGS